MGLTTDISKNKLPEEITTQQASFIYANEADLLNVALFGITAKEWRGSNLESINALLIRQGLPQRERLIQLNKVAITQMKSLLESNIIKTLK